MPSPTTPSSPRAGSLRRGGVAVLLAAAGLAACIAPREGHQGSAAEFGELVVESGAQPVGGTVRDGEAAPMGEPLADPTPDQAAAILRALEAEGEQEGADEDEEPAVNPYVRFGERAEVHEYPDGTVFVSKPYYLPPGKAEKIQELIGALEPFPFAQRPGPATYVTLRLVSAAILC